MHSTTQHLIINNGIKSLVRFWLNPSNQFLDDCLVSEMCLRGTKYGRILNKYTVRHFQYNDIR